MTTNIIKTDVTNVTNVKNAGMSENFDQAMKLAEMISKSDLAPQAYRGKPENTFIAMQMGAELGLAPMQSIQNIAVINGRPCVWGDAMLALAQGHPKFEDCKETFNEHTMTASCTVIRKGSEPYTVTFSKEDAKLANLWGNPKKTPWLQYPKRMLQMRARGFALRDTFADALRGIISVEEARDCKTIKTDHKKNLDRILKKEHKKIENKTEDSAETNDLNFISEKQLKIANNLLISHKVDIEKCFKYFNIVSLSELEANRFDEFCNAINKHPLKIGLGTNDKDKNENT